MKAVALFAALLLATPLTLFAHGDEDHAAPAPSVTKQRTPRAVARSDEFEAVAVLEGKKLLLYLDRFASNAPVTDAKVEIEGGGFKGLATQTAPGVYVLDAALIPPSKQPLTISIATDDSADLLSASLDVGQALDAAAPTHSAKTWMVGIFAATLVAVSGLLWLLHRRKALKGSKSCAN